MFVHDDQVHSVYEYWGGYIIKSAAVSGFKTILAATISSYVRNSHTASSYTRASGLQMSQLYNRHDGTTTPQAPKARAVMSRVQAPEDKVRQRQPLRALCRGRDPVRFSGAQG